MKTLRKIKAIPLFVSDNEEVKFWESADSTQYFTGKGNSHLKMPKRTTSISVRLPNKLLGRLKKLANMKDVPYQSLLKIYLDEKIGEEISNLRKAG